MKTIKAGMDGKQMKKIAMNNMAIAGKKPMAVPGTKYKRKMTQAQDDKYDRLHGIKEGSKQDIAMDRKNGIMNKKRKSVKTSGKFDGKSNKLGQGGRAAQLKAQGVPGGVIGNLARRAQAAPGQANYHKSR